MQLFTSLLSIREKDDTKQGRSSVRSSLGSEATRCCSYKTVGRFFNHSRFTPYSRRRFALTRTYTRVTRLVTAWSLNEKQRRATEKVSEKKRRSSRRSPAASPAKCRDSSLPNYPLAEPSKHQERHNPNHPFSSGLSSNFIQRFHPLETCRESLDLASPARIDIIFAPVLSFSRHVLCPHGVATSAAPPANRYLHVQK